VPSWSPWDYRLAPEATGTALVGDCYQGLLWVAEHSQELGIDPTRTVTAGASTGGGLAAGVTLMSRDLGTPANCAQMLIGPMLDHRNTSTPSLQYAGGRGVWTWEMNEFGWGCVLGASQTTAHDRCTRPWCSPCPTQVP
jgi:acetyl esterase/lipase